MDNGDGMRSYSLGRSKWVTRLLGATGILPYQQIVAMVKSREINAIPEIEDNQIQPASIDLRLGRYAYRVRASFLPGAQRQRNAQDQANGWPATN